MFGVTVSLVESGNKMTSMYDIQRISNGTLAAWEDLPEDMKNEYGEEYFRQGTGSCCIVKVLAPVVSSRYWLLLCRQGTSSCCVVKVLAPVVSSRY